MDEVVYLLGDLSHFLQRSPQSTRYEPMQLTTLLIPTYTQMLKTLSGWLKKAQAQLPEAEAQELLYERLEPDMFPL